VTVRQLLRELAAMPLDVDVCFPSNTVEPFGGEITRVAEVVVRVTTSGARIVVLMPAAPAAPPAATPADGDPSPAAAARRGEQLGADAAELGAECAAVESRSAVLIGNDGRVGKEMWAGPWPAEPWPTDEEERRGRTTWPGDS